jgi:hypothetical protein
VFGQIGAGRSCEVRWHVRLYVDALRPAHRRCSRAELVITSLATLRSQPALPVAGGSPPTGELGVLEGSRFCSSDVLALRRSR